MNKICPTCSKEIRANNFKRHFNICVFPKPAKKVYGIDYDPNHGFKDGSRQIWNKSLSKDDPRVARYAKTNSLSTSIVRSGCCTKEWNQSSEGRTKAAKGGGYREGSGRSKKFYVSDSFGKIVCLQSTYELEVSKILDELKISWIRPKALKYSGRNYFADFFLTDYAIYLDPKNDFKARLDEIKIES